MRNGALHSRRCTGQLPDEQHGWHGGDEPDSNVRALEHRICGSHTADVDGDDGGHDASFRTAHDSFLCDVEPTCFETRSGGRANSPVRERVPPGLESFQPRGNNASDPLSLTCDPISRTIPYSSVDGSRGTPNRRGIPVHTLEGNLPYPLPEPARVSAAALAGGTRWSSFHGLASRSVLSWVLLGTHARALRRGRHEFGLGDWACIVRADGENRRTGSMAVASLRSSSGGRSDISACPVDVILLLSG